MQTQSTVEVRGKSLKVKVAVTNEGDESAYNVQIYVNENHRIKTSHVKRYLDIKESFEYESHYDLVQEKQGRYPLIIGVDYTDANEYPFTATAVTYYSFGSDTVPKIFGSAGDVKLTGYAKFPLKLRNMDEVTKEVHIYMITPKELSVQEKVREITLQPQSELTTIFDVNNLSALPGSRYQVFFILEYEDESKHYSSVIPCFINLDVLNSFFKKYKWYFIGGPSTLFIVFIVFQFLLQNSKQSKQGPLN